MVASSHACVARCPPSPHPPTHHHPTRKSAAPQDIVAGLPDDLVNRYSAYAYFPFQDQGRTPLWFEPYLQKAQRDNKRWGWEAGAAGGACHWARAGAGGAIDRHGSTPLALGHAPAPQQHHNTASVSPAREMPRP